MIRQFCLSVVVLVVLCCLLNCSGYAWAAEEVGNAPAEHAAPSLNPIEFVSNTAAWTLVIFLSVCGILYKYAFGPIAKALDEREQGILNKIASAQKQNDEAKALLEQYQTKLDTSKDEVRQLIETAKKDAERQAEDIVAKAREAASMERDRAMKEIESAAASALQSIAERSAVLATNLAGKMIRAEVKPEQHRNLIDAALQEFTSKG